MKADRRLLLVLGSLSVGTALAVTVISTYLPVLAVDSSNALVVGALVGGEGLFGIVMPGLVGAYSDRVSHRVSDRLRLLVGCAVVLGVALLAVAAVTWLGGRSVIGYAIALVALYAGYYALLAPYWSLYPGLVPPDQSGRSRSVESTFRVIGVGLALIAGGLLLDLWAPLPFVVAAVVLAAVTLVLVLGLRARWPQEVTGGSGEGTRAAVLGLLADPHIRNLCVANTLWNFALSSLRAFVVLFFTIGLDRSTTFVSGVIFPAVAVGLAVAAPASGWLADKVGHVPVLMVALVGYAVGMAIPGVAQQPWLIAVIPVVAAGAATVMTLPFSVLMRLLPESDHGTASGLFGLSRGFGGTLGPIVTGGAILVFADVFADTHGYAVLWLVCSAALLVSIPFLWTLRGDERLG